MKKLIIYSFFLAIAFSACTEKVELDLNTDDNVRLVVDAWLTTEQTAHLVKLNLTTDYFEEGIPDAATNAVVTISDGTKTETLTESSPGHYYTAPNYFGEENKTYTLEITYDGEVYNSTSTLLPVTTLDSIHYEFWETEINDDDEEIDYYDIYAFFQEPSIQNQYYLFKMKINDDYYTDSIDDWFFTDDASVNGNYIAADFFEFPAIVGDKVTFEQYSVSKEAYEYLNSILLETVFRGGLFDGAPANVASNISNGAIGVFVTADVEKASLMIE